MLKSFVIAVGLIVVLVAAISSAAFFLPATLLCHEPPFELEAQTSPNGTWIVARYIVDNCSDFGDVRLSIRHPQEAPAGSFFLSVPNDDAVLVKWLDDSRLLVAMPEGIDLHEGPDHFKDVQIIYSVYPRDPDRFRDANLRAVVRPPAKFDYDFKPVTDLTGLPSVGCELDIETIGDGDYIKRLFLRLYAGRNTPVKAYDPTTRKARMTSERSNASFLVSTDRDYMKSPHLGTAMSISVPLNHDKASADRNLRLIPTPNGRTSPGWQTSLSLDEKDTNAVLDQLKSGKFEVKLGFWLDGAELIYQNIGGANHAFQEFEACMNKNGIFRDKP